MDPQPQPATGPVSPETQLTWKSEAAAFAADRVANGATLGLGSGSTAELALQALAQRIKNEGLRVTGVPTSERTRQVALSLGIPLADLDAVTTLDMSIDGADEVLLPSLDLVKGHGGALLREKMIAAASRYRVIVVDATKIVQTIGATGPIPVEVVSLWLAAHRHTPGDVGRASSIANRYSSGRRDDQRGAIRHRRRQLCTGLRVRGDSRSGGYGERDQECHRSRGARPLCDDDRARTCRRAERRPDLRALSLIAPPVSRSLANLLHFFEVEETGGNGVRAKGR